ncbi:marine proteobacterial sortase target protein [Pelagibius litoralis]|uniref:Marine proteobacterial sortase target protein n=1 Tax=Pelagibius litoralis TaxID=374515 RepID=A0A967KAY4_9PROT|nr:marine proteobacterial sortase target protein [Pelagibius litoralis]NIA71893.1 marine proteobacterial sortase target protein [Pelagibius litoralis]
MRHEMLPYRPFSLIPPQMVKACLRAVFVIGGALVILALVMVLVLAAGRLSSAYGAEAGEEMPSGLFFRGAEQGTGLEAPTLSSDVTMAVNGMVNRVTVRQVFHNPTSQWMEGIYVFPLPDGSAVDRLTMTIGERQVEGRILEKAEAERAYKAAAENGQRASLVSGERPNVFVTSVANIGPGENITVEIGYQDAVAFDTGVFSLRFPMVVAPRYTPAPRLIAEEQPAPAPLQPAVGSEPDDARDLFGPVSTKKKRNPLSLTIDLNAGVTLESLRSLHHPVVIESRDYGRQRIALSNASVPADRDFVLEWTPTASAAPRAAVFAEQVGEDSHLLVMMLPPDTTAVRQIAQEPQPAPMPRELVFIIDTSGSMFGDSLDQAKTAVIAALKRLNPEDRFNVIQFNSETHALYRRPMAASVANVARAFHYVSALEADGGTEMAPALDLALTGGAADGKLSQIVFLTDGAVGNEHELFELVADQLGDSRLFTIGIGSAPNSYFMRKSAELGRGSFTHIGDLEEVASRMETLLAKLENPALTDIRLGWPNAAGKDVEAYPGPLPDLYAGAPVTFTARLGGVALEDLEGQMLVTGTGVEGPWQQRLKLMGLKEAPGTASLWARAKLEAIEDRLYETGRGDIDRTAVRADALALALEHSLVTRYTSLVAIDDQVARPQGETLESQEIERNLPDGWDAGKVFGSAEKVEAEPGLLRQLALPAPLLQQAEVGGQAVLLPQGATPAERMLIIGLAYLLLGLALLALVYRRSRTTHSNQGAALA